MLPILFPILADTVVAPVDDFTLIRVHEWGVVTFTSVGTSVTGAPEDTYGFDPFGMVLVDARGGLVPRGAVFRHLHGQGGDGVHFSGVSGASRRIPGDDPRRGRMAD
jgi:hypothetical protein